MDWTPVAAWTLAILALGVGFASAIFFSAARAAVALGLALLGLLPGCGAGPQTALDLDDERAVEFDCGSRPACWSSPETLALWEAETPGSLRSPSFVSSEGATLVLRLRASHAIAVEWEGEGREPRPIARLEPAKAWAPQLFAVPLAEPGNGRIRLRPQAPAAPKAGRSAEAPDLSYAELRPRGAGGCYRHPTWQGSQRFEGVVCLPPAAAELAVGSEEVVAVRVANLAGEQAPSRVEVRVSDARGRELRHTLLERSEQAARSDARVDLPARAEHPLRLRFDVEGEPGRLVAWSPQRVRAATADHPNVLVYLVDTLRADALGAYGADRPTPHFDALAREGVLFERAIAAASWTLPSVASLFTGRDALSHGALHVNDQISDGLPTLAERFRAGGHTTAAITASPLVSDRHKTHRGFQELYDVHPGRNLETGLRAARSSVLANERAIPWIQAHAAEPFFLYVHVIDPHQPYDPPESLLDGSIRDRWPAGDRRWQLARSPSTGRGTGRTGYVARMEPTRGDAIVSVSHGLYEAAVERCDQSFGRLMAALDDAGVRERTLVVVLGDHGEEFLEHGMMGHENSLYDDVVHVPLILSLPGALPVGLRIEAPAGLVDVGRTLLELAGLPPGSLGEASLLPLIRSTGGEASPRPLFIVHRSTHADGRLTPIRSMDGLVEGDFKLIRNGPTQLRPTWELYDLASDPGEHRNLVDEQPDVAAQLRSVLEPLRSRPEVRSGEVELDEPTRERLRALGYVE